MEIRRAQTKDLELISELSEVWEKEDVTYGLKKNTTQYLQQYLNQELWVVTENEIVVGYLLGEVKSNNGLSVFKESDSLYFELEEIYVHPQYREQGFGTALLKRMIGEELTDRGIYRITVSTANKDWTKVMDFYNKNGFKTWTMTMFK
ncbi:ribosomal protein S18 acetylase RimI-like enzyme [Paenibacillus cellulosilyticus]|uniref:Ribosomal protein S18 acetylase RimI-like enzyme n=1 Tax=Paenibacillus cellulosilyticus TaxID=375489 RepID=A0A2V2Y8U5_9BACL|nr:GNAT family N-acetyltransferase [Paenibacillus cellulosilyticus]PWV87369.1 ribosomal protein S18 acetylase RimI-like enzyme [Paenibacillus cellulosilyticus]QKS44941.1 GNAT family N-acetyltransferase [Paenibacillus cellulosilyticus]